MYFLAVIVTPFIAAVPVPLFDWVGYGQMRPFVKDIITIILWAVEMTVILIVEKKLEKKAALADETISQTTEKTENGVGMSATNEKTAEENAQADTVKKAEKKPRTPKIKTPLLPMRNVFFLTGIVSVCILVLSAQIDFQVKPFYDIGEKVTGYDLFNKVGVIVRNCMKCAWIVWMLSITRKIALELSLLGKNDSQKQGLYFGFYFGLFMLFALYDVLTSGLTLGFGITYFCLFYPAFMVIDGLTMKQSAKSFVLILLIYIF